MFALVPAGASGGNPFTGGCLITVTASWSPGLKQADTSSTMSWATSSPICAGTALFTGANANTAITAAELMNCTKIVRTGTGSFAYDGASLAGFMWAFVGTTGGGTITIIPNSGIIVGVIQVVSVSGLTNCQNNVTQTSVAFTGVLSWVEVA